jgi:hypothetical protein
MIVLKAEQAARDSRLTKQDRYSEMRRRKDEEREAKERMLVGDHFFCVYVCACASKSGFLVQEFCPGSYRKKKPWL